MPRRDGYAQDYFTLRSTYFQGRPPASVNMHWRRFAISSIPLDDPKAFEQWLMDRWREKDKLLEEFYATGSFPAAKDVSKGPGADQSRYYETEVKLGHWFEIVQIFVVLMTLALLSNVAAKIFEMFF